MNKFVIGGGWSAGQHDLGGLVSYGTVIGVNDACLRTNAHIGLTMDRLWFENRWAEVRNSRVQHFWVREKCDANVPRKNALDRWQTFRHFNKPFPSEHYGELHGGNSGTCAINLALQNMGEGDNLFLLGFDMCKGPKNEPYWYPPYPWANPAGATKQGHFDKWVRDMAGFAGYCTMKRINVFNVSMRSQIRCWPKLKFEQMMEMLDA